MADKKLTQKQKDKLQDLFKNRKVDPKKYLEKFKPKPKRRFPEKGFPRIPKSVLDKLRKKKKDGVITFKELERMQKSKPKVMEAKKGGSAKFPDLSGDGKVTQKDILIGRGVIKRKNGGPAAGGPKKKRTLKDTVKKVIESFKNKPKVFGDIIKTGPKRVPRPKLPKPKKPGEITRVPRPKLPKPSDFTKPKTMTPASRRKPRKMADGGFSGRAGIAFDADNKLRRGLKRISDSDAKFNRERKASKAGRLAKRGYGKARS